MYAEFLISTSSYIIINVKISDILCHTVHFYFVDITAHPTNVVALVGTTINLMCEASGGSKLMYQWMRKGSKMIPSKATGVRTQRLAIHNAALDDSGKYKCDVSSGGASVSSNFGTVTVLSELYVTRLVK